MVSPPRTSDYTHGIRMHTYTSAVDPRKRHATWVEIDLGAIEGNARALASSTDAQLMAVVKANGYGHGAVETARAARRGGATWFGVARPEEALELRDSGFRAPVLVLGPAPPDRLSQLVSQEVSITVCDADQIEFASRAAQSEGVQAKAHLKLDTGMSRLGASPSEAKRLARSLSENGSTLYEGVFTHFARADEPAESSNREQLERFNESLSELDGEGLRPLMVHAANSAATFELTAAHFDMVRVGIALYGLQPSREWSLPDPFRPALAWKSQLTRVRELPPGTGVSYGHEYVTQSNERIGTIPVGYADGLRRTDGNQVLVGGSAAPVAGRVCMDLSMLQLDAVPQAVEGDEVVLVGRQGAAAITAENVAERWGTINYEVTCGIGRRVPRLAKSESG